MRGGFEPTLRGTERDARGFDRLARQEPRRFDRGERQGDADDGEPTEEQDPSTVRSLTCPDHFDLTTDIDLFNGFRPVIGSCDAETSVRNRV